MQDLFRELLVKTDPYENLPLSAIKPSIVYNALLAMKLGNI